MKNICDISVDEWLCGDEQECLKQIEVNWNQIPSFNVVDIQNLQEHKLVRFSGMIQDMFDPEFYFDAYEVSNKETQEITVKRGKYKDSTVCAANEHFDFMSSNNITKERQTLVVITMPGLNKWVLKHQENSVTCGNGAEVIQTSYSGHKRSLEDSKDEDIEMKVSHSTVSFNPPCVDTSNKKLRTQESPKDGEAAKPVVCKEYLLNLPLPEQEGKACHVKIYEEKNVLKLNELVECVGFLSLEAFYQDVNDDDMETEVIEMQTHNPPTSLVPKLHCVHFRRLQHSNPLLNVESPLKSELSTARRELEGLLTQLLLGDRLAAEYLLYHLISRVYSRQECMVLGKFTINFSNAPVAMVPEFGKRFSHIFEEITCKSYHLPMSLENMNDFTFIPKKDYESNRLTSGILQLSDHTHLILDETRLTPGKLNEAGVSAVAALSNIIRNQTCQYDFNYYRMDFQTDIPIVILSEGKSLLPCDIHVRLQPQDTFEPNIAFAENLTAIRKYLTYCRFANYEISDSINELVQNEFVAMRADKKSTADDLHTLLVLARYICLAEGKSVLDEHCWRRACELECARKQRLSS